ncbi:DUF3265 domain-containing protein [Vibrio parahaemolyticus]|nr:DUF3265 domain-containing protein [Vibrio parahaemolyticus]
MTNASRRIRNAWHFYHASILVIKVVCGSTVLRCSPLKRALVLDWHQCSKVLVFIGFDARFFTCTGVPFTFFPVALDVCFSL